MTARRFLLPAGFALAIVVAAVGVISFAGEDSIPWPQCWLRRFTGIPCPSCGCTRSFLALCDFNLAAALRFNPLFVVTSMGGLFWLALWLAKRFLERPWLDQVRARIAGWPVGQVFLVLLALNWLYLCLKLPK